MNCDVVEYLLEKDQRYRNTYELSPYFFILDSLIKEAGYKKGLDTLNSLDMQLQDEFRSEAKHLKEIKPKRSQNVIDSLWNLQRELDFQNTKQLIEIVKSVGFQVLDTMNFECSEKSYIIFVHTPDDLKSDVRTLIESGKGYISPEQFQHILWHLDGRKIKR